MLSWLKLLIKLLLLHLVGCLYYTVTTFLISNFVIAFSRIISCHNFVFVSFSSSLELKRQFNSLNCHIRQSSVHSVTIRDVQERNLNRTELFCHLWLGPLNKCAVGDEKCLMFRHQKAPALNV